MFALYKFDLFSYVSFSLHKSISYEERPINTISKSKLEEEKKAQGKHREY